MLVVIGVCGATTTLPFVRGGLARDSQLELKPRIYMLLQIFQAYPTLKLEIRVAAVHIAHRHTHQSVAAAEMDADDLSISIASIDRCLGNFDKGSYAYVALLMHKGELLKACFSIEADGHSVTKLDLNGQPLFPDDHNDDDVTMSVAKEKAKNSTMLAQNLKKKREQKRERWR